MRKFDEIPFSINQHHLSQDKNEIGMPDSPSE
jgi:hypothetical protein